MRRSVLSTLLIGSAIALLFRGRKEHGANHMMAGLMSGRNQPSWLINLVQKMGLMRIVSAAYGRGLIRRLAR